MEQITGYENLLKSLADEDNRNEGTILLLETMLKKEPSRVNLAIEMFDSSSNSDVNEILATLIVKHSEDKRFQQYLIDNHEWDESDFSG